MNYPPMPKAMGWVLRVITPTMWAVRYDFPVCVPQTNNFLKQILNRKHSIM
jgi:hypothetical protein